MEKQFAERCADFDANYSRVQEEIARAAERGGRQAQDVTLLAATKTVPAEVIVHGISRGLRCLGENRVQELLAKYEILSRQDCDLQFIGRLQTNKVKALVGRVSCIQSVDSVRLAREISRQCVLRGCTVRVLAEVNIGREESKGGVPPEGLYAFIDEIRTLPGIRVCGLMTIPPATENEAELGGYFSEMQKDYVDIGGKRMDNVSMDILSMGMSSDFSLAISCGANMVRVGSALFGTRG